jgi:DNA-binding YbaB/EbfC family protein
MRNMQQLMKQAQAMQAKMAEAQEALETLEVSAASGGGLVKVTANGKGLLKSVQIDPSLLASDEKEILEDLLVAAVNEARNKAEAEAAERMKDAAGGLPLPPGLGL